MSDIGPKMNCINFTFKLVRYVTSTIKRLSGKMSVVSDTQRYCSQCVTFDLPLFAGSKHVYTSKHVKLRYLSGKLKLKAEWWSGSVLGPSSSG